MAWRRWVCVATLEHGSQIPAGAVSEADCDLAEMSAALDRTLDRTLNRTLEASQRLELRHPRRDAARDAAASREELA